MNQPARKQRQIPFALMICDSIERTITFVVSRDSETTRYLEQFLPCRFSEMYGKCIDTIHSDAELIRQILEDDRRMPVQKIISIGDLAIELQVSAIRDRAGIHFGSIVSWSVHRNGTPSNTLVVGPLESDRAHSVVGRVRLSDYFEFDWAKLPS